MGFLSSFKFIRPPATAPGEIIVFKADANHLVGFEGVVGRLYLTNKRLVFKAPFFRFSKGELSMELTDIKAEKYPSKFVFRNGLVVTAKHNKKEKFVVHEPDEWVHKLNSLC